MHGMRKELLAGTALSVNVQSPAGRGKTAGLFPGSAHDGAVADDVGKGIAGRQGMMPVLLQTIL